MGEVGFNDTVHVLWQLQHVPHWQGLVVSALVVARLGSEMSRVPRGWMLHRIPLSVVLFFFFSSPSPHSVVCGLFLPVLSFGPFLLFRCVLCAFSVEDCSTAVGLTLPSVALTGLT